MSAKRVTTVAVPVALPDTASLDRLAAIMGSITRPLGNGNGGIRGIADGDPSVSLTGAIEGNQRPGTAQAAISARAPGLTPATIQDVAVTMPNLAPYNSMLLDRMHASAS
jgi:hypothetical protein